MTLHGTSIPLDGPDDVPQLKACLPHPEILITETHGPQGFTWTNPVTGATEPRPGSGVSAGAGSETDPFRIEGLCVPTVRGGVAVTLADVSVNVTISDNLLPGGLDTTGIQLDGASNVVLEGNVLLGHATGIHLISSSLNLLADNHLERTQQRGIVLNGSAGNGLVGNTVLDTGDDLGLGDSAEGIRLAAGSDGNHLEANTVLNTKGQALLVIDAQGTLVHNNTLSGNDGGGLLATQVTNLTITLNSVRDNDSRGIDISDSERIYIGMNRVERNPGGGIRLDNVYDVNVTGNQLNSNRFVAPALLADSTSKALIEDNVVTGMAGVRLVASSGNVIRDNQFSQVTGPALHLDDRSDENYVRSNDMRWSVEGLRIEASHDNLVRANWLFSNHPFGIHIIDATGNTFDYNAVGGHSIGIRLEDSSENEIIQNHIVGNADGIQVRPGSPGNLIKDNNIGSSRYGLLTDAAVDARENYWDHWSGPGGGAEDGCKDATANGDGDIIHILTSDLEVCFHPHRTSPSLSTPNNAPP